MVGEIYINENRFYQGDFDQLFQELKDDTVMFFRQG